jgi:hypothetical protein
MANSDEMEMHLTFQGCVQRWWKVGELLGLLKREPGLFTGVHYPVLLKAALDLQSGAIKVGDAENFRPLTFNGHKNDGTFSDLVKNGTLVFSA